MKTGRGLAAAALLTAWTNEAQAQTMVFDVPPGTVGSVATQIGSRAGITITVPDPAVANLPSPGVHARTTVRGAIEKALANTGARPLSFGSALIRVVSDRKPAATPRRPSARSNSVPALSVPDPGPDIVVIATKQRIAANRYPGSVSIVDADRSWLLRNAAGGTSAITSALPTIQSTDLGQGRDKLFIRGVADSSFRGQTQAATGQYLGDVRLTYSAPDPSLNLYDMNRIEVLVGPQAPLYGAGSLGGVVRLEPNPPEMGEANAQMALNLASTRSGGLSSDAAAVVNVPIIRDQVAARLVVFGARQAGYIDAPAQGIKDINDSGSHGHRLTLRATRVGGWTIDAGDVLQVHDAADGQYTLRGRPALTRDAAMRQPFTSHYRLNYVTARRAVGDADVVSTTAHVDHHLYSRFDATPLFGNGAGYDEGDDIDIWEHETRWTGGQGGRTWVVGISGIQSSSSTLSELYDADTRIAVRTVRRTFDSAAFSQVTAPFGGRFAATVGGRISYSDASSRVAQSTFMTTSRFSREAARLSRMAALAWNPDGSTSAYIRYEQGYRAGGLNVYPTESGDVSQVFRPDTLDSIEIGLRAGDERHGHLFWKAAAFASTWANVQADIATLFGVTVTANVGRGTLQGLEAEVIWRPTPAWTVRADMFVNDGTLLGPNGNDGGLRRDRLPNVAAEGARIAATRKEQFANGGTMTLNASARYVGRSWLGAGEALDIPQGGYLVTEAGLGWTIGRTTVNLQLENATDVRGNTFAYGNPFTALLRDQITPLRPRTVKISIERSL